MKRFITLLLVSLSAILLIACSKQSSSSLDGEYDWINESRNETVDISGTKQEYYKKDSEAYKKALKKYSDK